MIYWTLFNILVIISLLVMFAGKFHGYAGAVILGLNTIFWDLFWQWLRFQFVAKNKTSYLAAGILGGLAVRVVSVFCFIELGVWWLGRNSAYFTAFAIFLLTIPLWSFLTAYRFKLEKK